MRAGPWELETAETWGARRADSRVAVTAALWVGVKAAQLADEWAALTAVQWAVYLVAQLVAG